MHSSRPWLALLSALAVSAAPSAAAQRPSQTVPRDLALALVRLISFGPDTAVDLRVGSAAPDIASSLPLPAGTRVLGAVVSGPVAITVLESPTGNGPLLSALRGLLIASGWRAAPTAPEPGGFQWAPVPPQGTLCDGEKAMLLVTPHSAASNNVYVISGEPALEQCRAKTPSAATRSADAADPTLVHPEGARSDRRGCGAPTSGSGSSRSDYMRSGDAPDVLLDHYGRELDSAGFRTLPRAGPGSVVTRGWERPDSTGRAMRIFVDVEIPPTHPECRAVTMRVER